MIVSKVSVGNLKGYFIFPENGNIRSVSLLNLFAGMWQVAGRHGNIDVKKAVNDMKLYAHAGLGVFDMADTCKCLTIKIQI